MAIINIFNKVLIQYSELLKENPTMEELVREIEITEEVFHSNAIENSSLSLDETEQIINDMTFEKANEVLKSLEFDNISIVKTIK